MTVAEELKLSKGLLDFAKKKGDGPGIPGKLVKKYKKYYKLGLLDDRAELTSKGRDLLYRFTGTESGSYYMSPSLSLVKKDNPSVAQSSIGLLALVGASYLGYKIFQKYQARANFLKDANTSLMIDPTRIA